MNSITRTVFYNAHPDSLIMSAGAVMGGLTASVIRGGISLFPAIMTLIFAVLLQATSNLYHGYFDLSLGSGENISGMNDRDSRALNSSRINLLKVAANGMGILTITAGLTLFAYVGWIGVAYLAVIVTLLYFFFAGPRPAVRTKWSVIFTFLFFGPICVSGTALIQNMSHADWLPVIVYSFIIGLLASNVHISMQYTLYEEDRKNGKETLMTVKGGAFTRTVYLANATIVTAILILRPSAVDFVSPWVGIAVGIGLLISSIWAFSLMRRNTISSARTVRKVTMYQYIIVTITLMAIVLYSVKDFSVNVLDLG